jgi:hypothetical protein
MRRHKEVLSQIVADLGGDISEAENIIVRRACTIAVWCEQIEAAMADGKDINIQEFTTNAKAQGSTATLRQRAGMMGLGPHRSQFRHRHSRRREPFWLRNGRERTVGATTATRS